MMQLDLPMHVPDALFETDNEYDIPVLDVALQARFVELPLTKWGDVARTSRMPGTYHFYTDDYKFLRLWRRPNDVIESGCVAIIEPNFSTNDQMPQAVGLWAIYRKRWLARYWQSFGIRVFVDLNVAAKFALLNLIGVPRGWSAYATRGLDRYVDQVMTDYELACHQADDQTVVFLVYGGGSQTKELCNEMGFIWIPENMHIKDGRLCDG